MSEIIKCLSTVKHQNNLTTHLILFGNAYSYSHGSKVGKKLKKKKKMRRGK